ncbi:SCO family protein [Oceanobacillus caeni]|uniref:Electron transporter SenC n=2 Tax=Oceanobacillus caeni TaxID=405946 RepID=A0ABR5MIL7_9BACI|nr:MULTISPECIES: SCO family protein [Bacillaceae]KKE78197.1 electron transporter SenC [Bacilli bacterium VT-13-104]PZD84733.1 SCO family protein [Bacilli bacterium]KPH74467.1 electron transporter SenC [Oceanobacillus caeni]MCR1835100.1 SCO family protein [Oceanobacillus caeni]MED4473686.1 SCO family protein [Oceanobacillus caeni]
MIKNKNTISLCVVVLFGVVLFFIETDGFQAFTTESARTMKLVEEQPVFPDVTLEDSKGNIYSFSEFKGKYVMITFVYTTCTSVCPELEMNLFNVYDQVPEKYIGEDIVFLSISFDPERDDVETLEKYRRLFGSDGETWRMARVPNAEELHSLLDEFGVIVIPDNQGNFTHNSAFYLVNPQGKLVDVMDYQKVDEAASKLMSILENEVGDK